MRSDAELQKAASHISHEIRHLIEHAVEQTTDDRGFAVVFLEAGLTHARNLVEFFGCPGASMISPVDFVPDFKRSQGIDADNRDLNNWLSHLTWLRVDEPAPSGGETWDSVPLVMTLAREFLKFVDQLPDERQQWFSDAVAAVKRGLEILDAARRG